MAPQNTSSSILGTEEVFFYDYWAKQYFSTTTVQQYAILDNDRNFRKLIASSNQSIMYMS